MALVRPYGDLTASRSSRTGSGALLLRKGGTPVKTYRRAASTIPNCRAGNDYRIIHIDKSAIKIASAQHSRPNGWVTHETIGELRREAPIHIYCYVSKLPVRAGQRADSACTRIPVSTWGVSFCGIFEALVAGVGDGHYRRHHGLDC